jgi:hypothetical protein
MLPLTTGINFFVSVAREAPRMIRASASRIWAGSQARTSNPSR